MQRRGYGTDLPQLLARNLHLPAIKWHIIIIPIDTRLLKTFAANQLLASGRPSGLGKRFHTSDRLTEKFQLNTSDDNENLQEKTRRPDPQIWVDADACPADIKSILFQTAKRLKIRVTLVANQPMHTPNSDWVNLIVVPYGADVADHEIARRMQADDVVITGDIPLAARVVEQGGVAIGVRGELMDDGNVHGRLASRNLMEQFRSAGVDTSGPRPLTPKDVQTFANALDRTLTRIMRRR